VVLNKDTTGIGIQPVKPELEAFDNFGYRAESHRQIRKQRIVGQKLSDLLVARALRVFFKQRNRGCKVFFGLFERIDPQAFRASQSEIGKGLFEAVCQAIVMSERFGHLGWVIAMAALDLLGDLQVQPGPSSREEALIKRVAY
jgi:hypothetical protein